jgi:hypothetical protein
VKQRYAEVIMNTQTPDTEEQATRTYVGAALIGVGAWSALHGSSWIFMRGAKPQLDASFVGAEGMLFICVIFVGMGLWLLRAR